MQAGLIVDGILILLVGAGIVFALRLQRALADVQKSRTAMEQFLVTFNATIARAEKAMRDLQGAAQGLSGDIDDKMTRAQGLRDELTFLIETADKVATRVADKASAAHSAARTTMAGAASEKEERHIQPGAQKASPPSPVDAQGIEKDTAEGVPAWARRIKDDKDVINKLPNPSAATMPASKDTPHADKTAKKPEDKPRSQSERELMQALEKMR